MRVEIPVLADVGREDDGRGEIIKAGDYQPDNHDAGMRRDHRPSVPNPNPEEGQVEHYKYREQRSQPAEMDDPTVPKSLGEPAQHLRKAQAEQQREKREDEFEPFHRSPPSSRPRAGTRPLLRKTRPGSSVCSGLSFDHRNTASTLHGGRACTASG